MTTNISKFTLAFFFICVTTTKLFSQDTAQNNQTFYTFIYNQVPDKSCLPVLGLINTAEGDYSGAQVGLTNLNQKRFHGAQVGFTNAIGKNGYGAQIGFVNASRDSFSGGQVGFVNGVGGAMDGVQVGFVNAVKQSAEGGQVGYVNVVGKNISGAQVAFVNLTKDTLDGVQVGFVNAVTGNARGIQVGFVNSVRQNMTGTQVGFTNIACKKLNGIQVGFVNFCDTLEDGVPIGFLSIVKKGGYRAIEVGASELYPVHASFKIGIRSFYTSMGIAYNPDHYNQYAWSAGFGSLINVSKRVFFNPELISQQTISTRMQHFLTLQPLLGYDFNDRFSGLIGPTVVWSQKDEADNKAIFKPQFSFYSNDLDSKNRLHVGLKIGLRYQFN